LEYYEEDNFTVDCYIVLVISETIKSDGNFQ